MSGSDSALRPRASCEWLDSPEPRAQPPPRGEASRRFSAPMCVLRISFRPMFRALPTPSRYSRSFCSSSCWARCSYSSMYFRCSGTSVRFWAEVSGGGTNFFIFSLIFCRRSLRTFASCLHLSSRSRALRASSSIFSCTVRSACSCQDSSFRRRSSARCRSRRLSSSLGPCTATTRLLGKSCFRLPPSPIIVVHCGFTAAASPFSLLPALRPPLPFLLFPPPAASWPSWPGQPPALPSPSRLAPRRTPPRGRPPRPPSGRRARARQRPAPLVGPSLRQ